MIVRILSSSASFHGVRYNTDKIDRGFGELMKVANFGVLQALQQLRPQDYKNELKAISRLNPAVKCPQFHVAISAPGKSFDKYQLTAISEAWLKSMGYGNQPYLIVFHNDTANNHVHIVSTRIARDGKKINRDFEHIKAVRRLNEILGVDEKQNIEVDLNKALTYRFSTIAQFKMILEDKGYTLKESGHGLQVIKFGIKLADLDMAAVNSKISIQKPDAARIKQVKAILIKYAGIYESSLNPKTSAQPGRNDIPTNIFTSELAKYLKEKHGLILIFHASGGKFPYGYSLVDHAGKAVYKGSEIMPLKELLAFQPAIRSEEIAQPNGITKEDDRQKNDSCDVLTKSAAAKNYPGVKQSLHHQEPDNKYDGGRLVLTDNKINYPVKVSGLLDESEERDFEINLSQTSKYNAAVHRQYNPVPAINLASDIDDEAINGRNRRRKKQASTNKR